MAKGGGRRRASYLAADEGRGRTRRSQVNARGGGRLLVVMMGERRRVVLSWRDVVKSSGSSIEHLESFQRSG